MKDGKSQFIVRNFITLLDFMRSNKISSNNSSSLNFHILAKMKKIEKKSEKSYFDLENIAGKSIYLSRLMIRNQSLEREKMQRDLREF